MGLGMGLGMGIGGGGGGKRVPRRTIVGQSREMGRMAREMLSVLDSQARISRHSTAASCAAIQQLSYLASILSFHISFTDFPKTLGSDGRAEHLSLVSLGVAPPRVCHGSGASLEEARNEAAIGALRALADYVHPSPSPYPPPPHHLGQAVAADLSWPAQPPPVFHPPPTSPRSAKIAAANSQLKATPAPLPSSPSPTRPPNPSPGEAREPGPESQTSNHPSSNSQAPPPPSPPPQTSS